MNDFTGRVAIITGGARGLGRAAAERLRVRVPKDLPISWDE